MSKPTALNPSNFALIRVVPPPQNGSKTVLPLERENNSNIPATSSLPNLCLNEYQLNGAIFLSESGETSLLHSNFSVILAGAIFSFALKE